MQGAFHSRAVVRIKGADALCDIINVGLGNVLRGKRYFFVHEAGGWQPAKVQDDLQQVVKIISGLHSAGNVRGQYGKHGIQVVSNFLLSRHSLHSYIDWQAKASGLSMCRI